MRKKSLYALLVAIFALALDGAGPVVQDITQYGAVSGLVRGVASCNGTNTIKTTSPLALAAGNYVTVLDCGPSSTLAQPAAPSLTIGATETATVYDAPIAPIAAASSTYSYKMLALDSNGSVSAAGAVTRTTTGPASLGEQLFTIASNTLTNHQMVFNTGVATRIPLNAAFLYWGGSRAALSGQFSVQSVSGPTVVAGNSHRRVLAYSSLPTTSNGGNFVYWTGIQLQWTWALGVYQYAACALRPGDAGYHIIGFSLPKVGQWNPRAMFTDYGPQITKAPPLPPWLSDASCNNTAATPDSYTAQISRISGQTITTSGAPAGQTASGRAVFRDSAPAFVAARAAAYGAEPIQVPPGTFYFLSHVPLGTQPVSIMQEGNIVTASPIELSIHYWSGEGYGNGSCPQFAWACGPGVSSMGAYPVLEKESGAAVIKYMIFAGGTDGLAVWNTSGGAPGQDTFAYDSFVGGTSNNDLSSIGMIMKPGSYGSTFDHVLFSGGPANSMVNFGTTYTPMWYSDWDSTYCCANWWSFNYVDFQARTAYWDAHGGPPLQFEMKWIYGQGNIMPLLTIHNQYGNMGVEATMDTTEEDTSYAPAFNYALGTGSLQGSVTLSNIMVDTQEPGGFPPGANGYQITAP